MLQLYLPTLQADNVRLTKLQSKPVGIAHALRPNMPMIEQSRYLPCQTGGALAPLNWRARKQAEYIAAQNANITVQEQSK
jgi:hypothetical protein